MARPVERILVRGLQRQPLPDTTTPAPKSNGDYGRSLDGYSTLLEEVLA